MQITFISFTQFFITVAVLCFAMAVYVRYVRPVIRQRPEFKGFYDEADTRWQKLFAWLKVRWDIAAATAVALFPIIWNGALDLIIAITLALADIAPQLAGLDLSGIVMPAWLKTSISIAGIIIPVIRTQTMKRDPEGE